ncbi:MAG TPA: ParB/RepB/Spo0J family partition protein [Actinobacteria bacterium]|nr:ParB/RepB/Spo0J family partition protein [Actinomycetota bacterium]
MSPTRKAGGRKSGLGRGLDALIPSERPGLGFAELPLAAIRPNPRQPRRTFDAEALEELASSIRTVGVLQPIVVRDRGDGSYELVAGERRLRAAELAGLERIPAVIRGEDGDEGSLVEALVENLQREDLTPLEEAAAYRQLMEDFGLTHEEVAARVGKSRSAVTNTLRLLGLPGPIQALVETGELGAGHARALLGLEDQAYAVHLAERIVAEGWSVRQVEAAVRLRKGIRARAGGAGTTKPRPAAVIELESRLAEHLGTKVAIDMGRRGGKLVIRFSSLDDLERIYRRFYS